TYVLHCRLGVVDRARISLHIRLHQPVLDCEHSVAVFGEIGPPVRIELAVAHLPSTAVDGDQHRRLVEALRRVKIAEQLHAVVLGKEDVVARHHLIVGLSPRSRHQQPRRQRGDPKKHIHGVLVGRILALICHPYKSDNGRQPRCGVGPDASLCSRPGTCYFAPNICSSLLYPGSRFRSARTRAACTKAGCSAGLPTSRLSARRPAGGSGSTLYAYTFFFWQLALIGGAFPDV